ncbi:hypothetical protein [Chitinophaga deserti]|uniref:hypothetical protein n=1 Tax=Chitinophaga deserti TaxID=2164099 RepID=UPI000D6D1B30|nr:hypothetical protein [Chitinophaga deserti]
MKRFNVSILAVVAVLAIGLTAFTKAEPVAKRAVITNCYTGVTSDCVSPLQLVFDVTSCANSLAQDEKAVAALGGAFVSSIDCQETQSQFCCAKLVQITNPLCATQPRLTFFDKDGIQRINAYAKIDAVFCRP